MTTELLINQIKKQIPNAYLNTDLKGYGARKSGKVRDLYTIDDKIMIVTTDRISAFDVVLTQGIPYKGQALNQTSEFWFDATRKIMNNHIVAVPDPNIMIAQHCEPIEVEVVIRGYITGSAWRRFKYLKENNKTLVISGIEFSSDLRKDEKLPEPVFTPTTKAQEGHDEEITPKELISRGIVTKDILDQLTEAAFKLYASGNEVVSKSGGILVDTKYEFGLNPEGEVVLIDEVHTADSSRFWLKDQYEESFEKNLKQKGLDKEYVRSWLRDNGFTGDVVVPDLPDDVIINASLNVIKAYELITAQKFKPAEEYASNDRLMSNLMKYS